MKHTPGPWEITPLLMARYSRIKDTRVNPAYRRRIIGPDDSEIKGGAKILMELDGYHLTDEEYNANAALIAAAPDLLEALERMANEFDNKGLPMTSLPGYAQAAIKQAQSRKEMTP